MNDVGNIDEAFDENEIMKIETLVKDCKVMSVFVLLSTFLILLYKCL